MLPRTVVLHVADKLEVAFTTIESDNGYLYQVELEPIERNALIKALRVCGQEFERVAAALTDERSSTGFVFSESTRNVLAPALRFLADT